MALPLSVCDGTSEPSSRPQSPEARCVFAVEVVTCTFAQPFLVCPRHHFRSAGRPFRGLSLLRAGPPEPSQERISFACLTLTTAAFPRHCGESACASPFSGLLPALWARKKSSASAPIMSRMRKSLHFVRARTSVAECSRLRGGFITGNRPKRCSRTIKRVEYRSITVFNHLSTVVHLIHPEIRTNDSGTPHEASSVFFGRGEITPAYFVPATLG